MNAQNLKIQHIRRVYLIFFSACGLRALGARCACIKPLTLDEGQASYTRRRELKLQSILTFCVKKVISKDLLYLQQWYVLCSLCSYSCYS